MAKYLYQVVDGPSVFSVRPTKIAIAKKRLEQVRRGRKLLDRPRPSAEIERVQELPNMARRYWRWRNGKWRFWDASDPSAEDLKRWEAPQ